MGPIVRTAFLLAPLLAVLAGCGGDEVALRIDLRTDLAPAVEFAGVETRLLRGDGRTSVGERIHTVFRSHDFVLGRRVADFEGLRRGAYVVEVALLDSAGEERARRVVRLEIEGSFLAVVVITRDCVAASCPAPGDPAGLTSCFGGRCVDPACFEHPSECGAPECITDVDCPSAADCAEARCTEGVCFYAFVRDACLETEWCHVERGCTPLGAPLDAGPRLDGGSSDGGPPDAGPSGVDACTSRCGPPVCVDGVAAACGGSDPAENWTGSQCCVDGPVACADGVALACDDAGEHWTGRVCCVDGPATCVDGVAMACADAAERWTGTTCCVMGRVQCVGGVAAACSDPEEHWTGTLCCVEARTCTAGSAGACGGPGEHWTGTMCCVE